MNYDTLQVWWCWQCNYEVVIGAPPGEPPDCYICRDELELVLF